MSTVKNQDDLIRADGRLDYEGLRRLCFDAGVDDVGFVDIDRPGLAAQKEMIREVFPKTRSVICLTVALNIDNARSPARYLNAMNIHLAEKELTTASRSILRTLQRYDVRGVYLSPAVPMDVMRPGKEAMNISHKPIDRPVADGIRHRRKSGREKGQG